MFPLMLALTVSAHPEPRVLSADFATGALECRACVVQAGPLPPPPPLEGEQELVLRIAELQARINGIDVNWPVGSLAAAYAGYVFAPFILVGIPLLIVGLGSPRSGVLTPGIVVTFIGGAGVALLVTGLVSGSTLAESARQERDELVRQRLELDRQLKELRKTRAGSTAGLSGRRSTRRSTPEAAGPHPGRTAG